MTSLTVDIKDAQEERVLLAFLNSLKYSYSMPESGPLSTFHQEELLRRESDFKSGKIKAEPWEKVKKRFIS